MTRSVHQLTAFSVILLLSMGSIAERGGDCNPGIGAVLAPEASLCSEPPQQVSSSPTAANESFVGTLLHCSLVDDSAIRLPRPALEYADPPEAPQLPQLGLSASLGEAYYASGWTSDLFFTAAFGDERGELYTANLSFERPFWGALSLALQPFGGVGVGKNDTTSVFGLDLIFKYPILQAGATTVDVEFGGGLQQAGPNSWPDDGTHFNFRTDLGLGMRIDAGKDVCWLFGGRWLHVSNAGIDEERNPGVNEAMVYGGWQIRF